MKPIYTNIRVLAQVKSLLNDAGLGKLLTEPANFQISIWGFLSKLLDENLLIDFMQIITRDKETDWSEVDLAEIKEYFISFFGYFPELLPEWLRCHLQKTFIQRYQSSIKK
ncbi:MAG: hypothetical protein FWG98_06730 [Candidatus Cloacimonetes bacterium]|nr:hypothetical protein [Candidatus Cloacimonadota bacterium]